MRISRQQVFLEIAQVVAKRSTCFRLNVGAVVVHDNRVISIGYNGSPPGEPHCTGATCPGAKGCTHTIHAEANALEYADRVMSVGHNPANPFTPLFGCDLYVTDSPCDDCADLIVKNGIKRVFFGKPYRIIAPITELIDHGIECYQVTPAGFIVNWATMELAEL